MRKSLEADAFKAGFVLAFIIIFTVIIVIGMIKVVEWRIEIQDKEQANFDNHCYPNKAKDWDCYVWDANNCTWGCKSVWIKTCNIDCYDKRVQVPD